MKIITIHGIRRKHLWYEAFEKLDSWNKTDIEVHNFQYGYFTLESFCLWWRRERVVQEFLKFYAKIVKDGEVPCIVAHSFGTYIFFKAIERYSSIKVDKVVFSGCILKEETNWVPFFENGQINDILNDVGDLDRAVTLSRYVVWNVCGSSGKNGFKKPEKFRSRIQQKKNRFDHSGGFYERHMRGVWVPFLQKDIKKFVYDEHILNSAVLDRIERNRIGDDIEILTASFKARIDHRGNYYATYDLDIKNNSSKIKEYVDIKTSADSTVSADEMDFRAEHSTNGNELNVEVEKDDKQFKIFRVHFDGQIFPNSTTKLKYKFRWLQTMAFEGDTDHWHISNVEFVKVNLNFYRKLIDPKLYLIRNHRVCKEIDPAVKQEKDGSFSYNLEVSNHERYDGLVFYYKNTVKKKHPLHSSPQTRLLGNSSFQLTKCTEGHIHQVHNLERKVEEKMTAAEEILVERRLLFNDGFLVVQNQKNNVIGYLEAVLWDKETFETFQEIEDFSAHFDIAGKTLYVIFLAVSETERKKGVGSWLMEEIEKVALRYSAATIALVARSELASFYTKRGFSSIKQLPNFLPKGHEGSIYMMKTI